VLVTGIAWAWALATPYFDGPDEGSHILRAYAVVSGDFVPPTSPNMPGASPVRAPGPLALGFYPGCLIGHYEATPDCILATASSDRGAVEAITTAGRYPPLYYAIVGAPLKIFHGTLSSVMLTRLLSGLICGLFLASAVASASQSRHRPLMLSGLFVAVTPQVIFTNAVVNPSALEISAAIGFWTAGIVMLTERGGRYDARLIARMGAAGISLVSAKTSGPAFLLILVLVLLVLAPPRRIIEVVKARHTLVWGALGGLASVGAVLWIVLVRPNPVVGDALGPEFTTARIIRLSIGSWDAWTRQMVGNFGWNDLPAPQFTFYVWILLIGALLIGAAVVCRIRDGIALALLIAIVFVLPVAESTVIARSIGFFYQGRYTLPLAVGLPLLAALALGKRLIGCSLQRRLLAVVATLAATAHFVAYVYAMHRYTVGQSGPLMFWRHPIWSPAVFPAILSLTMMVLLGLAVVLVIKEGGSALGSSSIGSVATASTSAAPLTDSTSASRTSSGSR